MRFGVLGPLAVWTDEGEPVTIPGLKVRALLADLLAHEGRTVSADRLVDDLWGDEPPGNPSAALQVRVSQLRKALEDAEPGGRELIVSKAPGYLLRAADVDAVRFAELLARAEAAGSPGARAALLGDALALWRGAAYADFADEEHLRTAVTRLEEQRLTALELHAEARLELGEHGLLVGELGDLVARHPLRERLRAAQMRALYRAGRQSDALAAYAELRERLADELGLDPGPDLVALHQAILDQDPALNAPAERPATNLPAALSKLIGREDALAEVRSLLGTERLVTLTGSGGVGKTRLALETASRMVGEFSGGAWLVELAPLDRRTPSLAEPVLAALDIRQDAGSGTPAERLADALRDRPLLLVLDNCEHVVDQVAELAELLLRAAPELRILATSREPLAVDGEVLWAVPPLGVPDSTDLTVMAGSDAVRLFVTRAAASARGFALDAGNAQAVAQLCRRLDGIPLALELAATRVRLLGVHGVVARLDDRFRLLASGQRGAPPRQQTLMAVIDWSWDLLSDPERAVLRRLAVHADGCTLEAAEAVCASAEAAPSDVLDLLGRLVDRSLVVVADGPSGVRYRMLESVTEYCLARLADAGELDAVRRAHAGYYAELAEAAEPHLYGHEQHAWLQRLDAESANLRAALATAADQGTPATALRLVNALGWYWYLRGRPAEARRAFDVALAGAPAGDQAAARAAAWRAGFALVLGEETDREGPLRDIADPGVRARAELFLGMNAPDLPTCDELIGRALTVFRRNGDTWGVAAALSKQAMSAFTRRDHDALARDGEEGARLFRELGDRWGLLQATEWLAGHAEMTGDVERAVELFTEGLRMAEELELWSEAARHTAWLGWIALQSAEYGRALELCGKALRQAASQGHRDIGLMAEMGLALAARRTGELDLADRHLHRLLDGVPRGPGVEPALHLPVTLTELGFLTELRGDPAGAARLHLEALEAAQRIGDPRSSSGAAEGLAAALAAAGSHRAAARLLGLAAAVRDHHNTPAGPSEQEEIARVTAAARAGLGEPGFAEAYEDGARLKLEDAADLAATPSGG
ncbi:BTAD domain-containing putative transcriptional regulator [Nonomuraea sp. NPDC023979]|uniref:AfsR/SARP family transcriptional regulator n=1 Tax=Nonomuraea sp. NPDC023979 TaxID=3154796 RepID=UPI003406D228